MKKSLLVGGITIAAFALSLSACGQAPSSPATSTSAPVAATSTASGPATTATSTAPNNQNFLACMVSDQGGFDDKSFNQTSYQGLLNAVKDLGISEKHVQSVAATDYATNVASMISAGCKIIIGVGFNLSDSIVQAAKTNPQVEFAIVDDNPQGAPSNVKPLVFNTNEAAFLGGYLAASISQSKVVGTYGGQPYPSVTIYMDGFAEGVAYFNQQKSASVKVLGWDVPTQKGTFVQSPNPFVDAAAGKISAQSLTSQGADVVFPVAGNAGTGALQLAQQSSGKISAIWVDTDGCVSAADYCPVMPTSVYKAMDVAVEAAIKDAVNNQFSSKPYIGTLANQGVGISPFHQWDSKISAATKSELQSIQQQIIAGTLKVPSVSAN